MCDNSILRKSALKLFQITFKLDLIKYKFWKNNIPIFLTYKYKSFIFFRMEIFKQLQPLHGTFFLLVR